MSLDLSKFLSQLLVADGASANVKASICRQIVEVTDRGATEFGFLVPALTETLRQRNVYLKTYATVTLQHITSKHEPVKDAVMAADVPLLCIEHLHYRDNDLLQYTLALLSNLSKSAHHRAVLSRFSIVDVMVTLLDSLPRAESNQRLLSELVGVIGQLCNEEEMWDSLVEPRSRVVDNLVELLDTAPKGSKLRSRLLFALKQLCVRTVAPAAHCRDVVGKHIPDLMEDLKELVKMELKGALLDVAVNTVLLFSALSMSRDNCMEFLKGQLEELLPLLLSTKLSRMDATRDRLHQLFSRVETTKKGLEAQEEATRAARDGKTPRKSTFV